MEQPRIRIGSWEDQPRIHNEEASEAPRSLMWAAIDPTCHRSAAANTPWTTTDSPWSHSWNAKELLQTHGRAAMEQLRSTCTFTLYKFQLREGPTSLSPTWVGGIKIVIGAHSSFPGIDNKVEIHESFIWDILDGQKEEWPERRKKRIIGSCVLAKLRHLSYAARPRLRCQGAEGRNASGVMCQQKQGSWRGVWRTNRKTRQ